MTQDHIPRGFLILFGFIGGFDYGTHVRRVDGAAWVPLEWLDGILLVALLIGGILVILDDLAILSTRTTHPKPADKPEVNNKKASR